MMMMMMMIIILIHLKGLVANAKLDQKRKERSLLLAVVFARVYRSVRIGVGLFCSLDSIC